jgi:lysophospholipase L1-like esterase
MRNLIAYTLASALAFNAEASIRGASVGPGGATGAATQGNMQIVGNRNVVQNAARQGTASSRTDIRLETRYQRLIGPQSVSQLRMLVPAFVINPNGELPLGNSFTWEAAIENVTPSMDQELFTYGTNLPTALDGNPFMLSGSPIGINLPAGAKVYLRQAFSVANDTLFIPVGTGGAATGDAGYISPSTTSQVNGTGAMTAPTGGTSFSTATGILLGVPVAPMAAVVYIGDSIADGTGDTSDAVGNIGFIARGLETVNGATMPYLKETVGSWTYQNATLDKAPRLRSLWPFETHAIIELGTNDIPNSESLATIQGYATAMCTGLHAVIGPYGRPLKVAFTTLMPRTTSTDSWATAANQTPVAGFAVGGIRDQYNAWLKANVGNGCIDYVIDSGAAVEDPAVHGAWLTNGTANYPTIDGIHPTTALHIIASGPVNSWASGIAP